MILLFEEFVDNNVCTTDKIAKKIQKLLNIDLKFDYTINKNDVPYGEYLIDGEIFDAYSITNIDDGSYFGIIISKETGNFIIMSDDGDIMIIKNNKIIDIDSPTMMKLSDVKSMKDFAEQLNSKFE